VINYHNNTGSGTHNAFLHVSFSSSYGREELGAYLIRDRATYVCFGCSIGRVSSRRFLIPKLSFFFFYFILSDVIYLS
jgi:hypothetical protein